MNIRIPMLAVATFVAISACDSGLGRSGQTVCSVVVDNVLVSGTNLVATGSFSGGQPVISLNQTIPIAASSYTNSSANFDLTGVPPGTYSVTWSASCDENTEMGTIDGSKVKSITIT